MFELTQAVGGIQITKWLSGQPQPTEQQIVDAGNDLTQVNGQTFSQWYAENRGDSVLTANKKANKEIDVDVLLRKIVAAIATEFNRHRDNWAAVKAGGTLAAIKAGIPDNTTQQITKDDVIAAIKAANP